MRKSYQLFVALMLCMLGATNVNAEEISLAEVPFWQHEVWGLDEPKNTQIKVGSEACPFVIGESIGQPYGDSQVNNFSDLSAYTQLKVTVTEGTPRFLLNRDVDEGQFNDDETQSHLIDNTRGGWCAKYFTSEAGAEEGETVYIVDLKQLVKDKGYAHLHAIKGANWANVTVTSMVVVTQGKVKQIGWVNLINNSNMEGDDVSSFFTKVNYGDNANQVVNSEITDGVGKDGSRGIVVTTGDKTANDYDNQFWFRFNEPVAAGTKYRVSFDYKADEVASPATQSHNEPSDYIFYNMFGNIAFATDWQTFSKEAEVTADQSKDDKKFLSVAFNLNPDDHQTANSYYFDNIKFEVYKVGTTAEYAEDVILMDFGFDTNVAEFIPAGSMRAFFDNSCATVKVNGKAAAIYSIEGLADGRFYIFLEEAVDSKDEVYVTLTNNFGLKYTSGISIGEAVPDFSDVADYNGAVVEAEGAYPYDYVTPTMVEADPENGSFNLPNSIKDFKMVFDKTVDCAALVATLNGNAMSVNPADGFAKEVTLTRNGDGDLPTGEYTLHVTKIYPEFRLADEIFGDTTIVVSIGKVEYDPNDVPEDLIPESYFANCGNGGIPEGFFVLFGSEERPAGSSYSSGSRMFDFGGGDFTKALYYREGYVEYGSTEDHLLSLTAGKEYRIHFNTAMWKGSGKTRFRILNEYDEDVMLQMIDNNPNVNGSTGAVSGSTNVDIRFTPETSGDYRIRWESANSETGDMGFIENLLANVSMKYTPNQLGLEETMLLEEALKKAKATRDANTAERYDGAAFDALNAAIEKYEAEMPNYTAPSKFTSAAADLDALRDAMVAHRTSCDEYDTQIKKAIDVQRQNEMPDGDPAKATKFTKTELFAQLKAILAKYNASSQWVDNAEPGTVNENGEEVHDWQLVYTFDELKDDAILPEAIAELKDIANVTSLLFTQGVSAPENANNGKGTGVAVLIDRLRLGAEALKKLGVAEDDELVVAANNSLTDDDQLAGKIKHRITTIVYGNLKDANNDMFAPVVDETTLEETAPSYDMTVFVKNPNTYKLSDGVDFTDESVPGWVTPEGYSRPGLTPGWGAWQGNSEIAQDAMFQTWGSSYRVEQTITDLPAGIYTVRFAFGERNNGDAGVFEDSYAYTLTSDGSEYQSPLREVKEDGEEMYIPGIGQAFPFASSDAQTALVEEIAVTDGELTIGVNAGPHSHTFFNEVRVLMTAPATGFDYNQAWIDGIDATVAQPEKVRAIELFDLNGRRISTARQGIVIVKKHMSDGTMRTEKVVKK
ncbi:MAG: hypothetical protein K6B13_02350 [Prevotella sp.]|nr:hypothetical protein [Prevotella sp.]